MKGSIEPFDVWLYQVEGFAALCRDGWPCGLLDSASVYHTLGMWPVGMALLVVTVRKIELSQDCVQCKRS